MNKRKQIAWLLCMIPVLIASGWHYMHAQKFIRLDPETLAASIDSTVVGLTVHQFDAEGKLTNTLRTPLLQHIPQGDVSLLKTPHITVAQANQPPWEIRSLRAKSYEGGKRITFMQQVVVHQKPDEKTQESTLKTEQVTYYPKEKRASTDLLITYEKPGNFIQSTGMNAYLDEQRVELLHKARGSYEPAKG